MEALEAGVPFSQISQMPVREQIGRMKYVSEDEWAQAYRRIHDAVREQYEQLQSGGYSDAEGV